MPLYECCHPKFRIYLFGMTLLLDLVTTEAQF
jgi:hypothetical protein